MDPLRISIKLQILEVFLGSPSGSSLFPEGIHAFSVDFPMFFWNPCIFCWESMQFSAGFSQVFLGNPCTFLSTLQGFF